MGLSRNGIAFLRWCCSNGVDLTTTATLGRQSLFVDTKTLTEFAGHEAARILGQCDGFAEPLLTYFGAKEITSIDASPFEKATRIWDLNTCIPDELVGRFSTVIDGGTLEHVFDYPTALRNALRLVAPDGHFIAISPTNNLSGHGFYQFSPELFFRVLVPGVTGFSIRRVLVCGSRRNQRWFEVTDPALTGQRQPFSSLGPMMLYVLAQKVTDLPTNWHAPQQSDYATAWELAAQETQPVPPIANWKRQIPLPVRIVTRKTLEKVRQRMSWKLDRKAFRRTFL